MPNNETAARLAKANALAVTLEIATRNMPTDAALAVVETMSEANWALTARVSRCRLPSDKTRALVVERFRRAAEMAVAS
jgi:hypothetical protein